MARRSPRRSSARGSTRSSSVGGDGTLRTAARLVEEGVPVVGVPKSIDNDIAGTDATIGFDTAVQIATEAIDRITTTAESHDRVMVVEVMGRTQGWIATHAGMAAGADAILVPEQRYDLEKVAAVVRGRADRGHRYSVVVVAEGVAPPPGASVVAPLDAFGFERLGGVASVVAARLEELTGFEARVTVLGHIQRGGVPTARDRVLATRFGIHAADLAVEGRIGRMVALRADVVTDVPLAESVAAPRAVPRRAARRRARLLRAESSVEQQRVRGGVPVREERHVVDRDGALPAVADRARSSVGLPGRAGLPHIGPGRGELLAARGRSLRRDEDDVPEVGRRPVEGALVDRVEDGPSGTRRRTSSRARA